MKTLGAHLFKKKSPSKKKGHSRASKSKSKKISLKLKLSPSKASFFAGLPTKNTVKSKPKKPNQPLPALVSQEVSHELISPPENANHLSIDQLIRPDSNLKDTLESFLLDQRSIHTKRAYARDLKRFVQYLLVRRFDEGSGLRRVDRNLIVGYRESLMKEGLEHTTIDRHLATLRSFFRWLVDEGLMDRNPAEQVRFLKPKRISKTLGFTDEEVRRILALPDLHKRTGAQHFAILMLLFYCGLRRSEICDIRTSQITTERDHPVIRLRGKGNVERFVVLNPKVNRALNHYLLITGKSLSKDQVLFSPIRNNRSKELQKPLDPSMIYYIVTTYAKKAGIRSRVSPHSCRATAISNARDRNVSDRAIQEFAGWASADMITRYDKRKTSVENSASLSISYDDDLKR